MVRSYPLVRRLAPRRSSARAALGCVSRIAVAFFPLVPGGRAVL